MLLMNRLVSSPAYGELSGGHARSYPEAIDSIARRAEARLVLVSPYLEDHGLAIVENSLVDAMLRRVKLIVVTTDVTNLGSRNSRALEGLRRAATRIGGSLTVREVSPNVQGQGSLHAKYVLADDRWVVLGSANLTRQGLERNIELGIVCGSDVASQVHEFTEMLLRSERSRARYAVDGNEAD